MFCAGFWGPHMHWFWVGPLFFMIMMFIIGAIMCRRAGAWRWDRGGRSGWGPFGCCASEEGPTVGRWSESPRQILDRRYASGEITREQYESLRRDLEAAGAPTRRGDA